MSHSLAMMLIAAAGIFALMTAAQADDQARRASPVATALEFVHRYGQPAALAPEKDRGLQRRLTEALAKSPELPWEVVKDAFDREKFEALAGGSTISVARMAELIEQTHPSRRKMNDAVRRHAELLCTQFERIEPEHRKAAGDFADWIAANHKPGQPLAAIIVCTGNTRRSVLGAAMGNLAAAYHGLDGLTFYSGGTEPDAFNPRTAATLRAIGMEVDATGTEAARGAANNPNPVYNLRWGQGQEILEFSKKYADAHNPQSGFAALMVCGEADDACPQVAGAAIRIAVTFADPKAFDGAAIEAGKYAERRDDIGRFMLNALLRARRQLDEAGAK